MARTYGLPSAHLRFVGVSWLEQSQVHGGAGRVLPAS